MRWSLGWVSLSGRMFDQASCLSFGIPRETSPKMTFLRGRMFGQASCLSFGVLRETGQKITSLRAELW